MEQPELLGRRGEVRQVTDKQLTKDTIEGQGNNSLALYRTNLLIGATTLPSLADVPVLIHPKTEGRDALLP